MPMIVDLSHPLVMLQGENGCGKSTLLHSIYYALRDEKVESYVYRLEPGEVKIGKSFLFDAEQHNPRTQLEFFKDQPEMLEFLRMASHGQVMLNMFRESFPKLPDGTILLLDEPEMALSVSNQRRMSENADGTGGREAFPHHLRHPLAGTDRSAGNLRASTWTATSTRTSFPPIWGLKGPAPSNDLLYGIREADGP